MTKTILMLVGPEYEDLEVWYPKLRLEEAGYAVKLAGMGEPAYAGKHVRVQALVIDSSGNASLSIPMTYAVAP